MVSVVSRCTLFIGALDAHAWRAVGVTFPYRFQNLSRLFERSGREREICVGSREGGGVGWDVVATCHTLQDRLQHFIYVRVERGISARYRAVRREEEKCSCISDLHKFPLYRNLAHSIWIWARCLGEGNNTPLPVHV